MKSALILHGKPTRERYENPDIPKPHNANWLPWLRSELGKKGIVAASPIFPDPFEPDFVKWRDVFERYGSDSRMAIVGHSAGAEFALRWLSENKSIYIRQLVLVAPWKDTKGKYGDFSSYNLDTTMAQRIASISIFNSLDDSKVTQDTVRQLRQDLPTSEYIEFEDYGHFMTGNNMPSDEFPELLNKLI